MLYLAVALAVLALSWAFTVAVLVRQLDRERREHGRREDLLVANMAHLAGRPLPTVREPFREPALVGPPELVDPDHWPDEELG